VRLAADRVAQLVYQPVGVINTSAAAATTGQRHKQTRAITHCVDDSLGDVQSNTYYRSLLRMHTSCIRLPCYPAEARQRLCRLCPEAADIAESADNTAGQASCSPCPVAVDAADKAVTL
jgi:hypothetical protein